MADRRCGGEQPMTARTFRLLLSLGWLLVIGPGTAAAEALVDSKGWPVQRELLPHRQDSSKRVELFWAKPEGNGPFPAILFIHGHQEGARPGAAAIVGTGRLGIMARQGYVAAAVSQPGYGNSAGPPDFCGPLTQQAVQTAIDYLRRQAFVRPDKVALFGYSRGAIAAAMVATQDPRLAAVVLGAGAYDFFNWHPTLIGIAQNISAETGLSSDAFMARSALYHAQKIRAPILLLHGAADERIPVQQVEAFAEKLKAVGVVYRIKIFPMTPHAIPIDAQWREVSPFLEQYLR